MPERERDNSGIQLACAQGNVDRLRIRQEVRRLFDASAGGEALFDLAFDNAPLMMHSIDRDGRICRVNRQWLARMGYAREEVVGKPADFLMTPDSAERARSTNIPRFWREGALHGVWYEYVKRDGTIVNVVLDCIVINVGHGREISISVVHEAADRAEESFPFPVEHSDPLDTCTEDMPLQHAGGGCAPASSPPLSFGPHPGRPTNEALAVVVDRLPDGVFVLDESGAILYLNATAAALFGRSRDSLQGSPFGLPIVPREVVDVDILRPGGEAGTAELRVENIPWGNQQAVLATVRDITSRRAAEQELRKTKDTLEAIFNSTTDLVIMLDANGCCRMINSSAAARLGVDAGSVIGKRLFELFPSRIASQREAWFRDVLRTKNALHAEDEVDGAAFEHHLYPVMDAKGEVGSVAFFFRDVTTQKRSQALILQTERIRAVGEMAAGVAHNFNNLLQIVIGGVQLALGDLAAGAEDRARGNLQQVLESSRFGAETVRRLQHFARSSPASKTIGGTCFDLSETVDEACEMTRPYWATAPERAGIPMTLERELTRPCPVEGKPNEMFEVVVNLIRNSVDAMPKGGSIKVQTRIADDRAILEVSDTGVGIPPENLGKIFQPFWTSKGFQGTGMGLSSSYGIVTRHGGRIQVESTPGQTTTFTVSVPLGRDNAVSLAPLEPEHAVGPLDILLVDDLRPVLQMIEEGLRKHNHHVVTALSGREAVEAFRNAAFDLVVCDLGMPHMNGWEVAKAVKRMCAEKGIPKCPFILLTGWFSGGPEAEHMGDSGVDIVVEKPVSVPQLLEQAERFIAHKYSP